MTLQQTRPTTAEEYLELPYHIALIRDRWEDGAPGWFAEVEELPGCMSQGRTPDEAVTRVRDAMLGWISIALEDGKDVPPPRSEGRPEAQLSGRLLLRMPRGLHGQLAREASEERISLNQYVVSLLAGATAWKSTTPPPAHRVSISEPMRGGAAMDKSNIHTVAREDGWANVREGASRASSVHPTKAKAVEAGREAARHDRVEHVIHNKDGKISERNSYGGDPHPPKG